MIRRPRELVHHAAADAKLTRKRSRRGSSDQCHLTRRPHCAPVAPPSVVQKRLDRSLAPRQRRTRRAPPMRIAMRRCQVQQAASGTAQVEHAGRRKSASVRSGSPDASASSARDSQRASRLAGLIELVVAAHCSKVGQVFWRSRLNHVRHQEIRPKPLGLGAVPLFPPALLFVAPYLPPSSGPGLRAASHESPLKFLVRSGSQDAGQTLNLRLRTWL